jgi:hypothetical protein
MLLPVAAVVPFDGRGDGRASAGLCSGIDRVRLPRPLPPSGRERRRLVDPRARWKEHVPMGMVTRWLAVCLFCAGMVGCADLEAASQDAGATRDAIQSDLGVDAEVGFRIFQGTGGAKTFVSVKLATTPPGEAAAIKAKVRAIVEAHFRRHVDDVDVAM